MLQFFSFYIPAARRPSIVTKMADTLLPENAPAKFECQVEGLPLPNVKWSVI